MLDLHEGVRELFLDAQTITIEATYASCADFQARRAEKVAPGLQRLATWKAKHPEAHAAQERRRYAAKRVDILARKKAAYAARKAT